MCPCGTFQSLLAGRGRLGALQMLSGGLEEGRGHPIWPGAGRASERNFARSHWWPGSFR
jgi:hypothetical protein